MNLKAKQVNLSRFLNVASVPSALECFIHGHDDESCKISRWVVRVKHDPVQRNEQHQRPPTIARQSAEKNKWTVIKTCRNRTIIRKMTAEKT